MLDFLIVFIIITNIWLMTNFNLSAAGWKEKFFKNIVRKLNDSNFRGKLMFFKTRQFNYTCKVLSAEVARSSIPKSSECVITISKLMWESLHSLRWALGGSRSILVFGTNPFFFFQLSCLQVEEKKNFINNVFQKLEQVRFSLRLMLE